MPYSTSDPEFSIIYNLYINFFNCKELDSNKKKTYREVADQLYEATIRNKPKAEQLSQLITIIKYFNENFSWYFRTPLLEYFYISKYPTYIQEFLHAMNENHKYYRALTIEERAEFILNLILQNSKLALQDAANVASLEPNQAVAPEETVSGEAVTPMETVTPKETVTPMETVTPKETVSGEAVASEEIFESISALFVEEDNVQYKVKPPVIHSNREAVLAYDDILWKLQSYSVKVLENDLLISGLMHKEAEFYNELIVIKNKIEDLQDHDITKIGETELTAVVDTVTRVIEIANKIEKDYRNDNHSEKAFMPNTSSSLCARILDQIFALIEYVKTKSRLIAKKLYLPSEQNKIPTSNSIKPEIIISDLNTGKQSLFVKVHNLRDKRNTMD